MLTQTLWHGRQENINIMRQTYVVRVQVSQLSVASEKESLHVTLFVSFQSLYKK